MHQRSPEHRVTHCVIGAGFQGLPIVKRLLELGEEVLCLDRNADVGGIWHTGAYESAHIISSKHSTGFSDFPMPERYPDFPAKTEMQRYFRSYAEAFGLLPSIRCNSAVTRVRPHEDPDAGGEGMRWRVETANGEVVLCRTVTIANGHHSEPRIATYPGVWGGETVRSNQYRSPDVFFGKRVLVVGSGNTACDAAVDASLHGRSVDVSIRDGVYFFPRTFMGRPLDQMFGGFPLGRSEGFERLVARFVHAFAVGDPARYGLPRPTFRILDRHPVINSELLRRIRLGEIGVRPEIAGYDDRTVHFVDGSDSGYDLIFWAIGYNITLPMLDPADDLLDWEDGLPVLFFMMMSPKRRGLFVAGLGQARTGGGPLFEGAGYASARMAAFEARDAHGVMARLLRHPRIRLAERWLRFRAVEKSDTKSRSLAEHQRSLAQLGKLLDDIGCPTAPSRTGRSQARSNLELAASEGAAA